MTLREAILELIKDKVSPEILVAKVVSFSAEEKLATVELNSGAEVKRVRVQSVVDSFGTGIVIEPKVDSYVLVLKIEGKMEAMFIVAYSEIQNISIKVAEKFLLNGDSFGGLVKSEKVAAEDKKTNDEINALKQILSAWVPSPGDGGTALKTVLATWYDPLVSVPKGEYENENVKHG